MFVRKKRIEGRKIAVQLCENKRENGKIRQAVLRHVGTVEEDNHEVLKKLIESATFLKKELIEERKIQELYLAPNLPFEMPLAAPFVPLQAHIETIEEDHWVNTSNLCEESRIIEGIHDVFGLALDTFGLRNLFKSKQYDILRHIVMARIAQPSSKLQASENLFKHFNVDISVDRMYRFMDALEEREDVIQKTLFNAFRPLIGEKVEVLFFDVTTLYFESMDEDELRRFGFSKDQKTHLTQVVLALATTKDGLPVGFRLFPGNTAETSTLIVAITEWKKFLDIETVTIIADRAMMNEKNISALDALELKYVIAAKLKKLPQDLQKSILERSDARVIWEDGSDTVSVQEHSYQGKRLIVSHSSKRERKDVRDREQILAKLKKRIGQRGSTKKLVTNRGYLSVITESGNSRVEIDEKKVEASACWDGLHGVITNIAELKHEEVLGLYRRLWVIEESFRINKTTLEMRPIYHYASRRIKAHILICYISFALSRYVQKRIAMHHEQFSIEKIRSTLFEVQYSVLKDRETGSKYRLPSKISVEAHQIYSVFRLKRKKNITKMV